MILHLYNSVYSQTREVHRFVVSLDISYFNCHQKSRIKLCASNSEKNQCVLLNMKEMLRNHNKHIEVVNEPIHDPPHGAGNGNYRNALGGQGSTG